jgi:hypothetical protein
VALGRIRRKVPDRLAQDFLPVRHEQDPTILRSVAVERAQPGLTQPRGENDQAGGVPGTPSCLQLGEGFELDGVRYRRRIGRWCNDAGNRILQPQDISAGIVCLDPGIVHRTGRGMLEQRLEGGLDLGEPGGIAGIHHPILPLHAVVQCARGQIRASDVGRPRSIREAEDERLRMEAGRTGFENAESQIVLQVPKLTEGFGFGHVQVIARQDAEAPTAPQEVLKVFPDEPHSTPQDERDREIGAVRPVEVAAEVRKQRLGVTSDRSGRFPGARSAVLKRMTPRFGLHRATALRSRPENSTRTTEPNAEHPQRIDNRARCRSIALRSFAGGEAGAGG